MTTTVIVSPVDETPTTVVIDVAKQGAAQVVVEDIGLQGPVGPAAFAPGADKQVLFNDGGQFAAGPGMVWDKATNTLTVSKVVIGTGGSSYVQGNLYTSNVCPGNGDTLSVGAGNARYLRMVANQFHAYNTYTDGANFERGDMFWSANQFRIGTTIFGTGNPARDVAFMTAGINRWQITGNAGHFAPSADNIYDIGGPGARPRSIYAGASVVAGVNVSAANAIFHSSASSALLTGGFRVGSTASLGFSPNANATSGGADLMLWRDAAGTLAQRNGTNPQTFRVYNSYTDASNYERLNAGFSGNIVYIYTEQAGTGVARPLALGTSGNAAMQFLTNGVVRWTVNGSGQLLPNADATYDVGSPTFRVRTLYADTVAGSTHLNFSINGTPRWAMTVNGHFAALADNTYDIGQLGANRPRSVYASGVLRGEVGVIVPRTGDVRFDGASGSHRMGWMNVLDGTVVDGPAILGWVGGGLGHTSTGTDKKTLTWNATGISVTGSIVASGPVTASYFCMTPVTFAQLPAAGTAGKGARAMITDCTVGPVGNFGIGASGGGTNTVPVYSDGVNWIIG